MPTPEDDPRSGDHAVFSGGWLRYRPAPGVDRFYQGYRGTLLGWWNGTPEFTIDAEAAAGLVRTFADMAAYVGGDWNTVTLDGEVLTVRRPESLGGGVHRIPPVDGRYRVGWGMAWHTVPAFRCDTVLGRAYTAPPST
jgi:hypothetical protein